jgi:hypothetical protein
MVRTGIGVYCSSFSSSTFSWDGVEFKLTDADGRDLPRRELFVKLARRHPSRTRSILSN